jgi:hypothetical protein
MRMIDIFMFCEANLGPLWRRGEKLGLAGWLAGPGWLVGIAVDVDVDGYPGFDVSRLSLHDASPGMSWPGLEWVV